MPNNEEEPVSAYEFATLDLHMHTRASDGTNTPEELLQRVREAGIELFAVTDHDAVHGCERVISALRDGDPHFLTGVEFSCEDERGKYHILGYGYDLAAGPINAAVEAAHDLRMRKVTTRLEILTREFGFEFPPEEIEALLANDNPGKPHIGNLMVKLGYAESKDTAIRTYLNKIQTNLSHTRPETAIAAILGSGGIPILAHPAYGDGDDLIVGPAMEERLRYLMDRGIQGVEAYYRGFTEEIRRELLGYASRYDLFVTAGSDYHGTNKPNRLGDTGLGDVSEAHAGLHRFLEACANRII